jgi:DNA-binding response OmpR family regulator
MTILVVVLDGDVRALVKHILEGPECHVLAAANSSEAFDVASSAEIDLLLTELAPLFDGRSIAEQLRLGKPGLPVLYFTDWYGHADFTELEGETILKKPFTRDELTDAIAAALRADPEL